MQAGCAERLWEGLRCQTWPHPCRCTPSCAERPLASEEPPSKSLFGPPLESAFDHEDFTGRGRARQGPTVGGPLFGGAWLWACGGYANVGGDIWMWAWTMLTSPLALPLPRLQQPGLHIQPIPFLFLVP